MTDEQRTAFTQLRTLARPHRYRVTADPEGWPWIQGRYGQIEYHDGTQLAAYTAGRLDRLGRLLSLPGITRHQVGDTEVRVLFPATMLETVATAIRARRRKTPTSTQLETLDAGRKKLGIPSRGDTQTDQPIGT